MVCEHLKTLEIELLAKNIHETYRGQAWGDDHGEWVYFDCVFIDPEKTIQRLHLPVPPVTIHAHLGTHSGHEQGFYCETCRTGLMGHHPKMIQISGRKTLEYI